jgi:hypothetical protein
VDEIRQSKDLFEFLIDFLSERVDAQNALANWKLGEELDTKQLIDAAVKCVEVKLEIHCTTKQITDH